MCVVVAPFCRSRLAIIPQDPFLFSGTIRENLDPCGRQSDQQLLDVLDQCHLSSVVNRMGERLTQRGWNGVMRKSEMNETFIWESFVLLTRMWQFLYKNNKIRTKQVMKWDEMEKRWEERCLLNQGVSVLTLIHSSLHHVWSHDQHLLLKVCFCSFIHYWEKHRRFKSSGDLNDLALPCGESTALLIIFCPRTENQVVGTVSSFHLPPPLMYLFIWALGKKRGGLRRGGCGGILVWYRLKCASSAADLV